MSSTSDETIPSLISAAMHKRFLKNLGSRRERGIPRAQGGTRSEHDFDQMLFRVRLANHRRRGSASLLLIGFEHFAMFAHRPNKRCR